MRVTEKVVQPGDYLKKRVIVRKRMAEGGIGRGCKGPLNRRGPYFDPYVKEDLGKDNIHDKNSLKTGGGRPKRPTLYITLDNHSGCRST